MNNKRKVLIIDNSTGITGALRSINNLTSALTETIRFIYAVQTPFLNDYVKSKGLKSFQLSFLEIRKNWTVLCYPFMLVINTIRILRIVRHEQIDLIHVNDLYNMCGVLIKIIRPKIKLVYHIRLLPNSYSRLLYPVWIRIISRWSGRVVACSNSVRNTLPEDVQHKTLVIYDATDMATPTHKSFEKLNEEPITMLYLSNFVHGKGQEYAIEAFSRAYKSNDRLRLKFVGGDLGRRKNRLFKEALINSVKQQGLADVVTFYDFVEDVSGELDQADIFLNFSDSESFSMTCLEALTIGLPVIATNSGGPAELINNGVTGILVTTGNVVEMTESILLLASDVELRTRMGKEGSKYVASKFNRLKSAKQLADVYSKLWQNSN
ncbi:MAG: glycosyltransferase family 4 protein [Cyclobacteriaceae bacterium]|nr:glycosyltransferase family 4 protein [Cyclobacteriaceae bacterium]